MRADFDITAEATVSYVANMERPYLIDYEEMNAPLKKSTLNIALYENGTLKSVNDDFADKSSAVLSNIGTAGVQVAKAAFGLPPSGVASEYLKEVEPLCNAKTITDWHGRDQLTKEIAALEQKMIAMPIDDRPPIAAQIEARKKLLEPIQARLTFRQEYLKLEPAFGTTGACPDESAKTWSQDLPVNSGRARSVATEGNNKSRRRKEKSARLRRRKAVGRQQLPEEHAELRISQ